MLRPLEDVVAGGLLDRLARVHHQHVVGDLGDHPEIMGDHDDRRAELPLQVADQVEDLGLHGDVERGGRLVGDQQLGVAGQGHRDHGPLPHAAGELVRVVVDPSGRLRNADPAEQVDRVRPGLLLVDVVVEPVGLDDLRADPVVGVHRRQRVLEDHRHLAAPQPAHEVRGGRHEFVTVEPDLAGDAGPGALVQAHDGQARHALAGAGLADDAQGAAPLEREAQAVDRPHQAVVGREVHLQVVDLEEGA
jgi:hypothetical protein